MVGCADRRIVTALGGILGLTILALPMGLRAQEPDEPAPEAQIEDPELRGRHAMHLRGLGGGRDMGMGMQGMRGRGMMMGRTMPGREMMGRRLTGDEMAGRGMMGRGTMRGGMMRRMMGQDPAPGSDPRWCPNGMGRGMCRGMARPGAEGSTDPGGEGGGTGG